MKIKDYGNAVLSTTYDAVTTLGTRAPDGIPYGMKVLSGFAQIATHFELSQALPVALVAVNTALKPAVKLVSAITYPFTELEGLVKSVKEAGRTIREGAEVKKEVTVKLFANDKDANPVATYKDKEVKEYKVDHFKSAEAVLKATAEGAIYVSAVASATETLASIGAAQISSEVLERISLVGAACATIFAVIGAVGTVARFSVASIRLINSKGLSPEEVELRKAHFKHATVSLAKTALKVALMVFAGYFSLAIQGVAALAIVAIDIYIMKTKSQLTPKSTIEVLPKFPAIATA